MPIYVSGHCFFLKVLKYVVFGLVKMLLKCRLWYEKSLKIFLLIQRGAETALQLILTQLQIEQMLLLLLLLLLMQLLLLL